MNRCARVPNKVASVCLKTTRLSLKRDTICWSIESCAHNIIASRRLVKLTNQRRADGVTGWVLGAWSGGPRALLAERGDHTGAALHSVLLNLLKDAGGKGEWGFLFTM